MNESDGSHAPDWGRFGIKPPSANHPVGDPTRWGVQNVTRIVQGVECFSNTITAITTRDAYARSWSIIGNLSLPSGVFQSQFSLATLECVMGVGQATTTHQIVLLFGNTGAPVGSLVGRGGLCPTQHVINGGPYLSQQEPTTSEIPGGSPTNDVLSFAAIGALVGQSIAIRAHYLFNDPNPNLPGGARLALMVTPYAAGEGL